jgi:hypothetical protein
VPITPIAHLEAVIPLRRMERAARKAIESWNRRHARLAQRPGRHHEHLRGQRTGGGVDPPAARVRVPRGASHLVVKTEVRNEIEVSRAALQVAPDLGLPREPPGPARFGREGERVEVRLDVARAAGIGVVAPGAADLARALEQDEVVFAVALQANRGAEAAEAGADDRNARVARRSLVRAHGSNG